MKFVSNKFSVEKSSQSKKILQKLYYAAKWFILWSNKIENKIRPSVLYIPTYLSSLVDKHKQ